MSDIVERLRDPDYLVMRTMYEAAAEIEQLRAYKREQAEDIITLGQMVGRCCPVCERRDPALKPRSDE